MLADERGRFDELVEDKGVQVLIDSGALMHVLGTKMDFVTNRIKCASWLCCAEALHCGRA